MRRVIGPALRSILKIWGRLGRKNLDATGCSCPRAQFLIASPARILNMDHRLFAVLVIVCFALEGAGCASESQISNREEILMPRQTGSILQRRVMVTRDSSAKKSKKKKESKRTAPKLTPKPTPAPEVTEEPTEAATPPTRSVPVSRDADYLRSPSRGRDARHPSRRKQDGRPSPARDPFHFRDERAKLYRLLETPAAKGASAHIIIDRDGTVIHVANSIGPADMPE